jgi:signal transduction histidine kinase
MMLIGRHSSIRRQLTCLVIACVLPVWLIAGLLVRHEYYSKLEEVNRDMLATARAFTMVVDRELASVQASLLALATSPSFRNGDFKDIHRQTLELLKTHPGADIIVSDITGQQLVNSFSPAGSSLPKRNNPEVVRNIFSAGKPVVSNLFYGAITKRPLIAIDVPVFLDGKVIYDLSMTFSSDRLAAVLPSENAHQGWFCSVLDGTGVIVARTRNPEQYVGKRSSVSLRRILASSKEGAATAKNIEGVPVWAAFCKSSMSNWAVIFGVPKAILMNEIYQWLGWSIIGATTISLFGIVLALWIADKIATAIQSLVSPALAIGRGESVTAIAVQSSKETVEVAEALVYASRLLRRQATERDLAEKQLSIANDDLRRETAERILAIEELREKEQLLIVQSRQAALGEMIGNIAHQWRQPLNALGLLIQDVQLFYEVGELNREFLDDHTRKSMDLIRHMSGTIDDFRNFFKPDKEKVTFKVHDEVVKTLSLMEGSLVGKQIAIEVVADDDPVVSGFPNEYCQVLLNVLINAKDAFAERGIAAPRVVITIGMQEQRAVVTIADNAGGIPEEIIGKVFDPYFTTKGPQAGTGVGLFMSKTIIEKNMGGFLTVRNVDGGAEFRIEV